jgi:hypothetical protein
MISAKTIAVIGDDVFQDNLLIEAIDWPNFQSYPDI